MSSSKLPRVILVCATFAMLLLFAGCWSTKFTLVAPEQAKVDTNYVGNWNSEAFNPDGREAGLVIRNIDGKQYYVEWRDKNEKADLIRAVGFIADVKGATFAQIRGLEPEGKLDDDWILMRLELSGNTLKIRQLSESFMKASTIESAEQLRRVLEQNLDNDAMYAKDEIITATRAAAK